MKTLLALLLLIGFSVAEAQSAADGEKFYKEAQCTTCHSLTSKKEPIHTGPPLYGVTKRPGRTKDWLVAWISDPESMVKTDKLAKQILKENNNIPMTGMLKLLNKKSDGTPDMDTVKKKAEAIYAFLKDNDSKPEGGAAAGGKKKKN